MNHELGATVGVPRAHGAAGAFVSKWRIHRRTRTVLSGEDSIQGVSLWNAGAFSPPALGVALGRLCSGDLPEVSAFKKGNKGTGARIYMSGEEVGAEGRGFAHVVTGPEAGISYQLPHLGRYSFENAVAHAKTGLKTVVATTDDTGPGEVYVYVGEKRSAGNAVERAGLVGGSLYGLRIPSLPTTASSVTDCTGATATTVSRESDTIFPEGEVPFEMVALGDVSASTGACLDSRSKVTGVTGFQRPEDIAWDPKTPSDLYFVTTATFAGKTRLWRARFFDHRNPQNGGTIALAIDGGEPKMFDNIAVDRRGRVLLQEDPGNVSLLARIWQYTIATGGLIPVTQAAPALFTAGSPDYLGTQDEETSGIIDASKLLGNGWYLLDIQVHGPPPAGHPGTISGELVENGQMLAIKIR